MNKPINTLIQFRGGELSIQASEIHYCDPQSDSGPYHTFEVAFITAGDVKTIPEFDKYAQGEDCYPSLIYPYVPVVDIVYLLTSEGYTLYEINKILPR